MPLSFTVPNFSANDLIEVINNEDPGQTAISLDGAEVSKVYMVPWDKRYDATLFCLGSAWVEKFDDGSGAYLRRNIPLRHPLFTNLYCKRVSWLGRRFEGKETTGINEPEWNRQDETTKYDHVYMTVEFGPMPFRVYTDQEILNDLGQPEEWERYCRRIVKPNPDIINVENGSFIFAEGPKINEAVPGQQSFAERKSDITLRWMYVPMEWTHNPDDVAVKIEPLIGTVNSTTFLGRAAGTLLLDGVDFEILTIPLITDDWQPYFANHIVFNFKYFNPPNGAVGSTKAGHNLLPDRGPSNSWLYYYATIDGNPASRALYEYAEHRDLFSYWAS